MCAFFSSGTHSPSTRSARVRRPGRRASKAGRERRLSLEPLEGRHLLALLGLAQQGTKPDVASGVMNTLSYTQVGNNQNPFRYSAIPFALTMPAGTVSNITNPTGGSASTKLSLTLNNAGQLVAGAGNSYAVTGKVTVGGTTYNGTLLTAQPADFGAATTFSANSGEFEVRMAVTGGVLTGAGGPFKVGDSIGLLIHQPGLKIATFPATFSITVVGSGNSDTLEIPPQTFRLERAPMPSRPALQDAVLDPTTPSTMSGSAAPTATQAGGGLVDTHDGAATYTYDGLTVPGRGVDWSLTLTYRSDTSDDGPLGHGWEMNANGRLEVVTPQNLAEFQTVFPNVKVGDVDAIAGDNRDDLYVRNPDGSYTSPAGFYTRLVLNPDGTYTESDADGMKVNYSQPDSMGVAPMSSLTDRNGDTMRYVYNDSEELTTLYDTYGRPYQYSYDAAGDLLSVADYLGRTTRFTYDASGNLSSVTSPAVTGTPTGNDFPSGMTTRFTYDANHKLLTATSPDEVADNGPPALTYTYDVQGRVHTLTQGGTNQSNVPSGGTITYQYQSLGIAGPGDYTTSVSQTTVTDRDGNATQYQYNQIGNVVDAKQETRGLRAGDPAYYETRYQYDRDYRLTQETLPAGNTIRYTYDTSNPQRTSQGDLLSVTETPDAARGGDQTAITTTYTYEPIYNQVLTTTEPRGNDPSYVPQNGGANSASRYTTTYTYDYQEGTNFAALGQVIGLSAAQTQAILAVAGVPMGLGDVNGDGLTNQTAGNLVRLRQPTVTLLPGSNEAAVEGTTSQPIVTKYTYNSFGQMTSTTDPEGNVTTYTYYPARDPNGDGIIDNPSGDATTGGYLKQEVRRRLGRPGEGLGHQPGSPAAIWTTYQYDAAGNMTRQIDGRGVATDYVYNQLNRLVEAIHAAATGLYGANPAEPSPLTAFRYVEMYYYDYNGNLVMDAVEDRGNTSGVQGSPPGAIVPPNSPGVAGADPIGGTTAFEKTIYHYDILGHRIEMDQEVSGGASPVYLETRYRYDPDGNLVLTILPEGNATATIYDERNLVLRTIRGTPAPPESDDQSPAGVAPTLLAPGDPTDYDVRGGSEFQGTTYRYDANGNVIETVSDDDNDLSPGNNDPSLGLGDRTLYTYDGFDRRTSVIDPVGNQAVYQYDPAGDLIRTTRFGPVDGPSPTSNGPSPATGPVSTLGVIQSGNLVNSNLLSATEYSYDELGRLYQTGQVLFVNTIPTSRAPDVAEGGSGVGLGDLTPGQTQPIPGVSGVTILGRVSDRTEYDRDSRATFRVEDDTNTSRTYYDGIGRPIQTVDAAMNTVQTAYDADGNVIETRETDVSQVPGVANESFLTTNYYDSLDRLQQSVDNLGESTSYRYDSRGDLVATADADGPVSGGQTISQPWAFSPGALTVNTTNGYGNVTGLRLRRPEPPGPMEEPGADRLGPGRRARPHRGVDLRGQERPGLRRSRSLPAARPGAGGGAATA